MFNAFRANDVCCSNFTQQIILTPITARPSCGAGESSRTGVTPCRRCEKGTFSEVPGSTSCTRCPPGQTTDEKGSSAATECRRK